MAGISLDKVRHLAEKEPSKIVFSSHAVREKLSKNINHQDVLRALSEGTLAKKEADEVTKERAGGAFRKFTLDWKHLRVTVKNLEKPRIISLRVAD